MEAASEADVVVVGAGAAGCSAATTLGAAGVATMLVQPLGGLGWRVGETLPPGARPLLQGLGVWNTFLADGHLPASGNRSAWGGGDPVERDFIFNPDGPGWQLDRVRFDRMLAAAATSAGAIWCAARPTALRLGAAGWWELELAPPAKLRTRLVMDATGRGSWVGRACGARRRVVDRLVGVVALLRPARESAILGDAVDPRTLVEAVETGWWYSASVPGPYLVAAYMTDPDLLPAGRGAGDHGWAERLASAPLTSARVGDDAPDFVVAPRVVAAGSSVLGPVADESWLAAGDAAATHDPLSSQGVATALANGRAAAVAGAAALEGDRDAMKRYAASVMTDYARYLALRVGYYDLERRWPSSPFWQRRQRRLAPVTATAGGAHTEGLK